MQSNPGFYSLIWINLKKKKGCEAWRISKQVRTAYQKIGEDVECLNTPVCGGHHCDYKGSIMRLGQLYVVFKHTGANNTCSEFTRFNSDACNCDLWSVWSFRTSSWADGTLQDPGTPASGMFGHSGGPADLPSVPAAVTEIQRSSSSLWRRTLLPLQGGRVGSHISSVKHEAVSAAPSRDGSFTASICLFIYSFISYMHHRGIISSSSHVVRRSSILSSSVWMLWFGISWTQRVRLIPDQCGSLPICSLVTLNDTFGLCCNQNNDTFILFTILCDTANIKMTSSRWHLLCAHLLNTDETIVWSSNLTNIHWRHLKPCWHWCLHTQTWKISQTQSVWLESK